MSIISTKYLKVIRLVHKVNAFSACYSMFSDFKSKIISKIQGRFIRNAGWIGSAEMFHRVSRLITTVILARYLTPVEFGVAAMALTANELIKVLAQNGIGARIIRATEQELDEVCNTAYRLNWYYCGSLFIIQCLVAVVVAFIYSNYQLSSLIACLSLVYLMMPFALVQAFLIQRQNRLKVTALISSAQVTVDNLLTGVMAFLGFGVWSIVLPKVIVAPVWIYGTLSQQYWKYTPGKKMKNVAGILRFGKNVLGTELAKVLRLSVDNIIVAWYFGLEVAGLYYFAKNAGMGISLSLVSAFNITLFAHLCEYRKSILTLKKEFIRSLKIISLSLIPLIILQSLLAQWYVPVIFGEQWVPVVSVMAILCLSVIPRIFGEAAGELLKVVGNPALELKWNVYFSVFFVLSVIAGLAGGIIGVAIAILVSHLLFPVYCYWVVNYCLAQKNHSVPVSD